MSRRNASYLIISSRKLLGSFGPCTHSVWECKSVLALAQYQPIYGPHFTAYHSFLPLKMVARVTKLPRPEDDRRLGRNDTNKPIFPLQDNTLDCTQFEQANVSKKKTSPCNC